MSKRKRFALCLTLAAAIVKHYRSGAPARFDVFNTKGDTFENDWMKLIFNATPIANIADNRSRNFL